MSGLGSRERRTRKESQNKVHRRDDHNDRFGRQQIRAGNEVGLYDRQNEHEQVYPKGLAQIPRFRGSRFGHWLPPLFMIIGDYSPVSSSFAFLIE